MLSYLVESKKEGKMKKVICSNTGGPECGDCKHNNPHDAEPHTCHVCHAEGNVVHESFCSCAINGGGGDLVGCYET